MVASPRLRTTVLAVPVREEGVKPLNWTISHTGGKKKGYLGKFKAPMATSQGTERLAKGREALPVLRKQDVGVQRVQAGTA